MTGSIFHEKQHERDRYIIHTRMPIVARLQSGNELGNKTCSDLKVDVVGPDAEVTGEGKTPTSLLVA